MLREVPFGISWETVTLLRYLLNLALKGQLRGVAICYWRQRTGHEVALTGVYCEEPDRALGGADLVKAEAARQLRLFA